MNVTPRHLVGKSALILGMIVKGHRSSKINK